MIAKPSLCFGGPKWEKLDPPSSPPGVECIHRTFALNKLRWQMSWEWSCWIVSNVKLYPRPFLPGALYYSFSVICIPQRCSRLGKRWFLHLILSEPAGANNKTAPLPLNQTGLLWEAFSCTSSVYSISSSVMSFQECFGFQMFPKMFFFLSGNHTLHKLFRTQPR